MQLLTKKLHPNAIIPKRANPTDAGLDLYSIEDVVVPAGEVRLVGTGIAVAIPAEFEGQVRSRSGLAAKNSVFVLNSPGTIDSGYRGELKVILANFGNSDYEVKIGDRIAQLIIAPIVLAEPTAVLDLDSTDRAEGGFGSSGK